MTVGNDCWIELSGVSGMPLPSRMPRVTQGTGTVPDDTAAVPPIESDVHVQVTGAGKTAGAWVYDQDGAAGMKWLPVVSGSSSSGGKWHFGKGHPSTQDQSTWSDGDSYLDMNTGDVYEIHNP